MDGVPGQLGVARGFNLEATPRPWGAVSLGAALRVPWAALARPWPRHASLEAIAAEEAFGAWAPAMGIRAGPLPPADLQPLAPAQSA